jgi:hypothetical protein
MSSHAIISSRRLVGSFHADHINPLPSPKPVILKRKMGVFVELALSEVFDFGFVWW